MESDLCCPLDGSPLKREPHGAAHFDHCPHCRGVWVSNTFLQGVAHRNNTSAHWAPPAKVHRSEHLECPGCSEPMLHRLRNSVQIDLCPSCKAVWLDGGEIVHFSNAVKSKERARTKKSVTALEDSEVRLSNYSLGHFAVDAAASAIAGLFD